MLLIAFAFLSGLVTIASPCVLPVLPALLSTGTVGGRLRPLGIVLGLVLSFTAATLAAAAAVQALALPITWLRTFAIVALLVFGLSMLLPPLGRLFERVLSPLVQIGGRGRGGGGTMRGGFGGGLVVGAGLGLLWAPCVGPIMASVIALAVSSGVSGAALGITLAYAAGAGMPMLLISYGARRLAGGARGLAPRAGTIRALFGALTVLTCVALLFGLESRLQTLLPTQISATLTGFERQAVVQNELSRLDSTAPLGNTKPQAALPAEPPAATEVPLAMSAAAPTAVPTAAPTAPTAPSIAPTAVPTAAPKKPAQRAGLALKDMGAAPEFAGITGWINSEPLSLASLRGKVVIVDFWTFGCYNCRNTRPYVRALYDKYHSKGLEIVGVHTPEFAYERVRGNIESAAKEQGVNWPIAMDPDFKTWSAYNNRYWPAFYFIDARGHLRYTHFGEGNYEYNDKVVEQLLSEAQQASN